MTNNNEKIYTMCGKEIVVMHSSAGYYLGTEENDCPRCRLSKYFKKEEAAQKLLNRGYYAVATEWSCSAPEWTARCARSKGICQCVDEDGINSVETHNNYANMIDSELVDLYFDIQSGIHNNISNGEELDDVVEELLKRGLLTYNEEGFYELS